jgi:23S rRNA pseudouridine1911/1915/1917 synthase
MSSCNDDYPIVSSGGRQFTYQITERQAGDRLDHFLAGNLPDLSRSQLISSVRAGLILVGGVVRKSSYRLKAGDRVSGSVLPPSVIDVQPEKIQLTVLYEDEFLLAISKPPGLVVHPGSGNPAGTLVNGLLYYCGSIAGIGDSVRPGIVHRLDKDTSGVMVIAKREDIHRKLVEAFKARAMEKEYLALVHGILDQKQGRLAAPIGRHPVHRQKMAVREMGGRHAATRWHVVKEFGGMYSLVMIGIETGRTHQIRVHMAFLGHPVAGDSLYGRGTTQKIFLRQMLHASRLRFIHPATGDKLDIEAPLWPDFLKVLDDLDERTGIADKETDTFVKNN